MKKTLHVDPRDFVTGILKSTDTILLAFDAGDALLGVYPEGSTFGGLSSPALGRSLESSLQADFVRIHVGGDSWDEIGYFSKKGSSSLPKKPWEIRRFGGTGHGFACMHPGAERFMFITPLPAYASLESLHEKSLEIHAREVEEINARLKRRSHKLKRAMDVLERRNKQNINEMNLAVELQKSLLPKSYPDTELVSFTLRYIPMAMVGGDFFDIIKLSDERIGVMISDVSGHGVAPAFITAMIRSSFDYLVSRERTPSTVIGRLNEEFSKIIDTDHYVTAFYAVFDFSTMTCRYCNAGHPHQLLAHTDGTFTEMAPGNPIIGMLDHFDYKDETVPFRAGDVLCFYTDGIIEARDANGVMFGAEGVMRSITASMKGSLDDMADGLLTDLIQYMKDPYFEDDITLLLGQVLDSL